MKKGTKKMAYVIGVLVLILIALRIALPFVVLHIANRSLANMKGYYGHINDVDIRLFRGAYTLDSIYLHKVQSGALPSTPFFSAQRIDLSIEWKALLLGSLVGEMVFETPDLLFTKDKVEPGALRNDSSSFKKLLDDFMPLRINRISINNGALRFRDEGTKPVVDIEMKNVFAVAQNLHNSYDSASALPATLTATATVYEGTLEFNMRMNPLAEHASFDLNTELTNTNLVAVNDFFQAYARVDVNKGRFGLYVEIAAKDGKYEGYAKPLVKDLDVLGKEDRSDNLFRQVWEASVGGVGQVLTNPSKDQVATKIFFSGDMGKSNTNIGYAIMSVLRNAFIQALHPAIDNEINLASVNSPRTQKKTLLQKIFNKKN